MPTRFKNWCFTDHELLDYSAIIADTQKIAYICYGEEICPKTNKKHIQGWVQFKTKQSFIAVKKIFKCKTIHIETCKGSESQNDKYCQKDNKYTSWGEFTKQGFRTDIHIIYNKIEEGMKELEISRIYPLEHAKFHKAFVRKISLENDFHAKESLKSEFKNIKLREWQKLALEILLKQSNRMVLWIVDPTGNAGKTYLGKYLCAIYNAFYVRNGKGADIAYAFNNEDFVIFDYTREQEERINYQAIENFKDGMLFSPKYESKTKIFKPCKVIIFSNFYPDKTKLSADRWKIMDLSESA